MPKKYTAAEKLHKKLSTRIPGLMAERNRAQASGSKVKKGVNKVKMRLVGKALNALDRHLGWGG
jgi:hypothetical protein